jgi:phage gp46-like protein
MSDTSTIWNVEYAQGDWVLSGPMLQTGNDLETAVLISLFTDRVIGPDDVVPDGSNDPRGWWGDDGQDYPIGSRLWLLSRAKQTQETLATARDYITEALQWLIDDGIASTIDVQTEWTAPTLLGALITINRTGGAPVAVRFAWAWNGIH